MQDEDNDEEFEKIAAGSSLSLDEFELISVKERSRDINEQLALLGYRSSGEKRETNIYFKTRY